MRSIQDQVRAIHAHALLWSARAARLKVVATRWHERDALLAIVCINTCAIHITQARFKRDDTIRGGGAGKPIVCDVLACSRICHLPPDRCRTMLLLLLCVRAPSHRSGFCTTSSAARDRKMPIEQICGRGTRASRSRRTPVNNSSPSARACQINKCNHTFTTTNVQCALVVNINTDRTKQVVACNKTAHTRVTTLRRKRLPH